MDSVEEVWPSRGREFFSHLLSNEHTIGAPQDPRERRLCATWITRACSDYGFQPDTGGLAVKYYDAFIEAYRQQPNLNVAEVPFKQLINHVGAQVLDVTTHKESQICELVCIVCIAVAAKKTEPKEKAPFLGDFDENFTFNELRAMERLVLKALQWSLCYSTPYDFTYYWMGAEKLRGSEREKTNELCHEAISKCTIENEFASPLSSSIFGSAAMLWAYYVQGKCTEKLEQEMTSHMGGGKTEELLETAEKIGSQLNSEYPQGFRPRRSDSPSSIMGVTSMMLFCDDMSASQGVKRPTPERFAPEAKKSKASPPQQAETAIQ